MNVTIKKGTIKFPAGKVFESKWGGRQNVVVTLDDGSEERIYFNAGQQPFIGLKRGDAVSVLFNGNKKTLAIPETPEPTQSSPAVQPQATAPSKDEIAEYCVKQSRLLRYCWDLIGREFDGLEVEQIQKLATTLYLSTVKRFNM